MGESWTFVVPGIPLTKRGADKGGQGQMHADGRTTRYEMQVAAAAQAAGVRCGDLPCEVMIELVLPNARRKDADRVASAIFDGLKRAGRAALVDDNLGIIQWSSVRLRGFSEAAPAAIITVRLLDAHERVELPAAARAREVQARKVGRLLRKPAPAKRGARA